MRLDGIPIDCRIVETPDPAFDARADENRSRVLVCKHGFSLNYRDRAYILATALNAPEDTFAVLGSEFSGVVIECGPDVTNVQPGDRVMGNGAYPSSIPGVPGGLPGNMQSKELQVIHASKVIRIPDAMSDEVAAGFSIGAQTTFSMVRKLALAPGSAVLVTGGRSNTSLFALQALRALETDSPFTIYVSTTSASSEQALRSIGVEHVIRIDSADPSFRDAPEIQPLLRERGGFDAVIDPFYDIHLVPAVDVLRQGGRYITCGIFDQASHMVPHLRRAERPRASGTMNRVMVNNLQIIGNCLGLTSDLERAIAAYTAGRFSVLIDRVFSGGDAAVFFERTYNAPERFGKVVYTYR